MKRRESLAMLSTMLGIFSGCSNYSTNGRNLTTTTGPKSSENKLQTMTPCESEYKTEQHSDVHSPMSTTERELSKTPTPCRGIEKATVALVNRENETYTVILNIASTSGCPIVSDRFVLSRKADPSNAVSLDRVGTIGESYDVSVEVPSIANETYRWDVEHCGRLNIYIENGEIGITNVPPEG